LRRKGEKDAQTTKKKSLGLMPRKKASLFKEKRKEGIGEASQEKGNSNRKKTDECKFSRTLKREE